MKSLNKKGFTLIELLAVIAILAILFMLVTPNILKMFMSGKQDAFITQVQSVAKAAEAEYMSKALSGNPGPYCSETGGTPLSISNSNIKYYVDFDSIGNISKLVVVDSSYSYQVGVDSNEVFSASVKDIQTKMKQISGNGSLSCTDGSLSGYTFKDVTFED